MPVTPATPGSSSVLGNLFGGIGNLFSGLGNLGDGSDSFEPSSACEGSNPCEASWQAAYAYAADKQYALARFQALQTVAFGILQYASADRTADLQYDIADRQMRIAEEEYARYKEHYVPCEDALNAEICALELPVAEYDLYADRATRDVRREFSDARRRLERSRNKYCMSDHITMMCKAEIEETKAVVKARDIAYRYAETRQDLLDARRWDRKLRMLEHGRNIFSGQSSDYVSGMSSASQALEAEHNAKARLFGTISGAIGAMGNAHYYPQINAPSVFGINGNSNFNTAWGPFRNGSINRNGVLM